MKLKFKKAIIPISVLLIISGVYFINLSAAKKNVSLDLNSSVGNSSNEFITAENINNQSVANIAYTSTNIEKSTPNSSSAISKQVQSIFTVKNYPEFKLNAANNLSINIDEKASENNSKSGGVIVSVSKDAARLDILLTPATLTGYAGTTPCGFIVKEFGQFIHAKISEYDFIENMFTVKDVIFNNQNVFRKGSVEFDQSLISYGKESDIAKNKVLISKDKLDMCGLDTFTFGTKTTLSPQAGSEELSGKAFVKFINMRHDSSRDLDEVYKIILQIEGVVLLKNL